MSAARMSTTPAGVPSSPSSATASAVLSKDGLGREEQRCREACCKQNFRKAETVGRSLVG